ncbi:DHH family phosphoesterase [Bacillus suaedae]|uniref:Bifunctional oligoribonuclease/PAP phosphatase NrnA n=1 Tax=Halalkalibacter suaedae TaxID=2822140 RepID=A0A941ASR9_9BACI|nr:bifunctional oligoribonuclease/PAP phosphatase NrnA [Bacillus suaedae]MBP3949754.1 bifunctional oligoribonuclease/PAP phosphatase NrnA [Bacillus suaedae]
MIETIHALIEQYEKIIIHRHERPDPDALGSQLGLAQVLREHYPEKVIYVVGEEEPSLTFLGRMQEVGDHEYAEALVIVCDTANTDRISDKRYSNGGALIKIDHHPNEEAYGDLSWVDTSFSSTSEMIVQFIMTTQMAISSESALLLYAGIVGDTGRFRYTNTTPATLKRASLLIGQGFDQNAFYSNLHKKELKITRLEGYILQHFVVLEECVGVIRLTKEILTTFGVTSAESSQLVNAFSDVEGLLTWVFFVEENDKIRVRLRSKGPVINTIAAQHHGGGHPMAAGATAYSWAETEEIILKLIKATT